MEEYTQIALIIVTRHLPKNLAKITAEYIGNTWDCGHTFELGKKPKKLLREAKYMKGPRIYAVCETCLPCHYCGVACYTSAAWHASGALRVSFCLSFRFSLISPSFIF